MFVTIDPYYSIEFYNETKEALKNNRVHPEEYISMKTPFNWYLDVPREPIMVNYDVLSKPDSKFLVKKVKALRPNEEYKIYRRNDGIGQKAILKYTENTPLREARKSDYAVFFNARSKEQITTISKEFPGKIWYMGRYFSNKYKVMLCTNKMILNHISPDEILLEKRGEEFKEPGRFEAEFNFKILRQYDYLEKYTETPYFKDGSFNLPKIVGDREISKRFII